MAVLRIAKMGNPVLLQKAAPVEDPTAPEIRQLAADMQDTLEDIGASGLAAPQVFVSRRVVVYRIIAARIPEGSGLQPRPWTVMVNPVITPKTQSTTPVWERCLSIPGPARQGPQVSANRDFVSGPGGQNPPSRSAQLVGRAAAARVRSPRRRGVSDAHDRSFPSRLQRRAWPARARGELEPQGDRPAVHRSGRALAGPHALVQRYKVDPMPKGQQKSNREKKKPKKPKPIPAQPGTPQPWKK